MIEQTFPYEAVRKALSIRCSLLDCILKFENAYRKCNEVDFRRQAMHIKVAQSGLFGVNEIDRLAKTDLGVQSLVRGCNLV